MAPSPTSCSVGVAFHQVPEYPTQWCLVLSQSQRFEGKVWCGSINETTKGRGTEWRHLDWSPSRLLPMGFFLGVIAIAQSSQSVTVVQDSVPMQSILSEVIGSSQSPTWEDIGCDSEKFVGLALKHLCERGLINLPGTDRATLPNLIRGRIPTLQDAQRPQRGSYPVVALKTGKITFARAKVLNQYTYVLCIVVLQLRLISSPLRS